MAIFQYGSRSNAYRNLSMENRFEKKTSALRKLTEHWANRIWTKIGRKKDDLNQTANPRYVANSKTPIKCNRLVVMLLLLILLVVVITLFPIPVRDKGTVGTIGMVLLWRYVCAVQRTICLWSFFGFSFSNMIYTILDERPSLRQFPLLLNKFYTNRLN